ncbi:MAG: sensor domain-containing diguanylate cyclase, partial [Caldisericaceae bacterium]
IDKFLHIIVSKYIFEKEKLNLERKERYLKKFMMLTELLDKVSHSIVLEEMHYTIISGAMNLFEADKVSLLDVSKGKGNYTFISTINVDYSELKDIEDKINSAYYGEHIDSIVRIGKVNYVQNTFEIPGWYKTIGNPESWIGIPLLNLDNKVMYVVSVSKNTTNAFVREDIDFAETFARNVNIALAKNLLIEKFRWDSITDPLTNLYNRREFEEKIIYEINQYEKYKTPFTLLVLDLDKFKKFNDTFGHSMGDRLLVEFARVLEKVVRKEDSIFRLGGDEFAVILRNTNSKLATQIAKRIKLNTQKIDLNVPFNISVSIGIKEYEGENLSDLLKTADIYLYNEKKKLEN